MTAKHFSISSVTADVLQKYAEGVRNFALEGSTRSTKTWSIFHLINTWSKENEGQGKKVTICRSARTWIKDTIYSDFNEFIAFNYLYPHIRCINETELIYTCWGNKIQLIGLDDPMKVHGRKQNILWVNEVMEAEYNIVKQMMGRTSEMVIFDWNPSLLKHWVFDKIIPRPDFYYQHSTYKDNPFLEQRIVDEIESTNPWNPEDEHLPEKERRPHPVNVPNGTADIYYWLVYAKGQRAGKKGAVFPRWRKYEDSDLPENAKFLGYGIDFGFSEDPAAVIAVWMVKARPKHQQRGRLYFKEMIYKTELTDDELADAMEKLGMVKESDYVCDSAEPKARKVLKNRGFRMIPAEKGADSVEHGIKTINSYDIYIHALSANMQNEATAYSYKLGNDGEPLNVVIDKNNHAWDAARYIVTHHLGKAKVWFG